MGRYHTAQICLNGHVITSHSYSELREKHCSTCGEVTTEKCEKCGTGIRGYYQVEGVFSLGDNYSPPSFCHNCGHPYPWTARKLAAACAIADELDEISKEEKISLKQAMDELTRDTPQTDVAVVRFKKIMKKVGGESYDVMKKALAGLLTEAVKKSLFGA